MKLAVLQGCRENLQAGIGNDSQNKARQQFDMEVVLRVSQAE